MHLFYTVGEPTSRPLLSRLIKSLATLHPLREAKYYSAKSELLLHLDEQRCSYQTGAHKTNGFMWRGVKIRVTLEMANTQHPRNIFPR